MAEQHSIPPATPDMAEKLAINRTGRLTPSQRRVMWLGVGSALVVMICPAVLLIEIGTVMTAGRLAILSFCGVLSLLVMALFMFIFGGMVIANMQMFLPDAIGKDPVRVAQGPLLVRAPERERPELPFSYIVQDYSFAPYVAPPDIPMRVGAPYLVYYGAHSRLLLSLYALDAPDADQWKPTFKE
jgi:hypothetical protein